MLTKLLLLFIGIPLIEILILIKMGELFGFWMTVWLVVATGILGAFLAKYQGLRVWVKIQRELQAGRLPAGDLVDGLLILIAGIVLLTPGLLTDILGFLLLIPWSRAVFKAWLRMKLERMAREQKGNVTFFLR